MRRYSPLAFDHPPATFQKENTILTDGVSFCDCPQVLLSALPPTARKGECEGCAPQGAFRSATDAKRRHLARRWNLCGFPHSRSITRPQAADFAQQNRPLQKENTILTDGVSFWSGRRGSNSLPRPWQGRALPDELRPQTAPLLQRLWCLRPGSNRRHADFQSAALPTELPRHIGDQEGARTLDLQRDRLAF